jgi:predicted esterase
MDWNSYENFWTEIVPNGYVICFPTTEMGISPDHQEFGQDLNFIATQMQIETQNSTSLFFNSLATETGLMGHSMGGGASFLAAENNSTIATLINFASAETDPSAISASVNISVPTLLFSGEEDCVAPPINHQTIMYDSLSSNCKTQVKIINGGHCNFADNNFNCNFGETFCNASLNITREEQQAVTYDFLNLWLDYSLKRNQNSFMVFNDSLQTSNRINYSQNCNPLGVPTINHFIELAISPNPATESLNLVIPNEHKEGLLGIYNLLGLKVYESLILNTNTQIDISGYPNGSYFIAYNKDAVIEYNKFVKIGH